VEPFRIKRIAADMKIDVSLPFITSLLLLLPSSFGRFLPPGNRPTHSSGLILPDTRLKIKTFLN
jgi:hypothetical protein